MQDDMLREFYLEAEELFNEAEDSLLNVEKTRDYASDFNSIFRCLHSVKGAAGMFSITNLQEHMHFLENLLESRKNKSSMTPAFIDYLLLGLDSAKKILNGEAINFSYFDPDNAREDTEIGEKLAEKNLQNSLRDAIRKRRESASFIKGHVYVVDDEVDILEMTKVFLEEEDFKVTLFNSAQACLDALASATPDLIVTDISMPKINGIELMNEVVKIKPFLPLIVVSGLLNKDVCVDALACGVSGIVEKPYDPDVFVNLVTVSIAKFKSYKLLNKSIDLLVYQFEDIDKYFTEKNDLSKRDSFRYELKELLKQKKILSESGKV